MSEQTYFKHCSSCKKEIKFGSRYYVCEVTSCKKFAFCSVNCWSAHNDVYAHKSAGAIEEIAPMSLVPEREIRRVIIDPSKLNSSSQTAKTTMDNEILIVASKLKQYVKEKYDLSTSANVMDVLSDIVRREADRAAKRAQQEGRKTLMDRDF